MTDMNRFLESIPDGTLSDNAIAEAKTIYDSLTRCFSTELTRVSDIILGEDGGSVSIVFTTPYLASTHGNSAHLASLFQIADAVAITPAREEDGFSANIIFTVVS